MEQVPADVLEVVTAAGRVDLERDVPAAVIAAFAGVPRGKADPAVGQDRKADRRSRRAERPPSLSINRRVGIRAQVSRLHVPVAPASTLPHVPNLTRMDTGQSRGRDRQRSLWPTVPGETARLPAS